MTEDGKPDEECEEDSHTWRFRAHRESGEAVDLEGKGWFDELVVGDWLHIEQMDRNEWWMRLSDTHVSVTVGENSVLININGADPSTVKVRGYRLVKEED